MSDGPTSPDEVAEELWHREQIRQTLMRYCRGVDRRDIELVKSTYHDDAYDDHGSFSGTRDEFLEWVDTRHQHIEQSMHCLGSSLIERLGDVAVVETHCTVYARLSPDAYATRRRYIPDETQDTGDPLQVTTLVRYVDRFERRDGVWRIADRVVVLEAMRWEFVTTNLPPDGNWNRTAQRDASDPLWEMRAKAGL